MRRQYHRALGVRRNRGEQRLGLGRKARQRVGIEHDGPLAVERGGYKVARICAHPKTGELVLEDTVASIGEGVDAKIHVMEGDPADQIIAAAETDHVDLLIVGNKGIAGVKGTLLGSIPQKVSEYAPCDVLIARTVTQSLD